MKKASITLSNEIDFIPQYRTVRTRGKVKGFELKFLFAFIKVAL